MRIILRSIAGDPRETAMGQWSYFVYQMTARCLTKREPLTWTKCRIWIICGENTTFLSSLLPISVRGRFLLDAVDFPSCFTHCAWCWIFELRTVNTLFLDMRSFMWIWGRWALIRGGFNFSHMEFRDLSFMKQNRIVSAYWLMKKSIFLGLLYPSITYYCKIQKKKKEIKKK